MDIDKQMKMTEVDCNAVLYFTRVFLDDMLKYDEGHIIDAINVPYDEIENDTFDKDKIIFVYCRSGNRSKNAFDYLNSLGYTVYDLGAFDKIDLPKG